MLANHWSDITQMVDANYAHDYSPNDLLVLSLHHHHSVEKIKSENPGHEKVIIYQLEPLVKNHWWSTEHIISRLEGADEIWDYDLDNIEVLKQHGIDAKFKPFLYTESLGRVENKEEPDIDILFYGTPTEHRSKILEIISNCGVLFENVVNAYNIEGKLLDEFIGRSKIILDLQDNYKFLKEQKDYIQKQSRIYYALINNKCVISEKSKRNYFGDLITECNGSDILTIIRHLLDNDKWKEYSNVSERFKQTTINDMISNTKEVEKNKIAVFYHIYQENNWKELYDEQINSLINSGIYEKCDFIHIGINGDQELPFILDKMIIHYNEDKILEANTLQKLWEFSKDNQDYKVLYFHSKGVTHSKEDYYFKVNSWRIYLEYFVIHNWKQCIEDLNSYDCVGAEWEKQSKFFDYDLQDFVYGHNPHYSGNFWWANTSYISNLDLNYIYNDEKGLTRWRSEFWIGTNNPNYKCYHNSNKLLYEFNYSPNYYTNNLPTSENNTSFEDVPETCNESNEEVNIMNHIYNQPQFGEFWFNCPELYTKMVENFPSGSKFVEVGSWKGMSSAYMAVEIANSKKNIDFYCVDTWEGSVEHQVYGMDTSTLYDTFLSNMSPVKDYYNPIRTSSLQAVEKFEDNSLDFVFIDASHEYKDVKDDIIAWLPKVKFGGIIAGHDYLNPDFPGVAQAVHELLSNIKTQETCWVYEKPTLKITSRLDLKESSNPKVFIVTPSRRPFNLNFIKEAVPSECEWVVVFDNTVKNDHIVENANVIRSPHTGFWGNPNRNVGLDFIKENLNPKDSDWIYILDDDNILHPNWWERVKNHLNNDASIITWGQLWVNDEPRTEPTKEPKIATIDTSQYIVRWSVAKDLRFENIYEADGIYAEEASKQGKVLMLDEYLGYYNFLRGYKQGAEIRTNICMISMFKNEAKGMRRMLESVWKHIDFYVFQDNGSTDGTPDIVREFFADKNIPGFIYEVEEGWVGFGWNRDHLLQTTLRNDHGCDWIMKMDCDEYLEVDDDFDWSHFYSTNIQSFHVTAQSPGCMYYRAWIWNAKLPWKFKHDVAHECIYLDDGITGENFQVTDLPRSLRMCGTNDGESYTVRTKYITDALKLEEKLIREETMLTDMYHFWYTGKSYMDCFRGDFYPLGKHHSEEFARRAIFYFEHYIDVLHQGGKLQRGINEMCYYASFCIGECYKFLGDTEKAIHYFKDAESFCSVRNEHIVCLAHTYNELGEYDKMLEQTTRLVDPNRKLPFPTYYFLIDTNLYHDSGPIPQHLHNVALQNIAEKQNQPKQFAQPSSNSVMGLSVNNKPKQRLWIVDDFYADPHAVREFALKQQFEANLNYYKGSRSIQQYDIPGTKEAFEKILGFKIKNWTETHGMCSRFQYCTAEDDLVYHCDSQTWAGMIYLTPDAPYSCGTSLFAHKRTGLRNENDFVETDVFSETGFYDRSKFELVDTAGNVFNRLVLFDAKSIHSANEYFGTTKENSRLFHLFFFD